MGKNTVFGATANLNYNRWSKTASSTNRNSDRTFPEHSCQSKKRRTIGFQSLPTDAKSITLKEYLGYDRKIFGGHFC
jgi:hypothetical protein